MICENKSCNKTIMNKRNATFADNKVFCSSECFIDRDLKIAPHEDAIHMRQKKIESLERKKKSKRNKANPDILCALDLQIAVHRDAISIEYAKIEEL